MSPPFAERPAGRVRKYFSNKRLRHFYVPFVGSTDAPERYFRGSMPLCTGVTLEA
jgi:hypothetical protein